MEIIRLTEGGIKAAARSAAAILADGGIVLYPTDTLYGLGADAFSDDAVAKIYSIKGRNESKPIHAIVVDLAMAAEYGEIDDRIRRLVETLPRGKVTLVVKKKAQFDSGITRGSSTLGFRVPDNDFCIAMLRAFGKPVTATSANTSGAASPRRIPDILAQLGDRTSFISLVIDAGDLPASAPSTVLDLSGDTPRILREGAVTASEVHAAIFAAGWQV